MVEYFKRGDLVKVAENNDNDSYDSFRMDVLQVMCIATNTRQHPGYDESMKGEPLYTLYNTDINEFVHCCLYFYELQEYERKQD